MMTTETECLYYPADPTKPEAWDRMLDLLAAVKLAARTVGWEVEEDEHTGAWFWSEDVCQMGRAGFATPEWEGEAGTLPVELWEQEGITVHALELSGNPQMDALRIVLKAVNAFTRGY